MVCPEPLNFLQIYVESVAKETDVMKRSRFTEEQIIGILKEQEAGAKMADVCRKYGISLRGPSVRMRLFINTRQNMAEWMYPTPAS